jgi:hypothetical protein
LHRFALGLFGSHDVTEIFYFKRFIKRNIWQFFLKVNPVHLFSIIFQCNLHAIIAGSQSGLYSPTSAIYNAQRIFQFSCFFFG